MSVTVQQHKNFVGGEWVDALDGDTMDVVNPSTGETIAEVPRGTEADVDRAVAAAKNALPAWLETTPKDRMELLLKLADVIDEHTEELALLESLNVGKPIAIARDEMPFSADNLRFFAGAARTLEGKSAGEYVEGYTSIIRREPLGIVAGITPWNYPLMMVVWKTGTCARRGQRPDHQAGRADAADDAALRRARAGRLAAGRAERRHRRRCPGHRSARASP
jgi:acyl-CoA reductase-like NAD-dependent aldehyde dehydrogenase